VVSPPEQLLDGKKKFRLNKAIIAMPSAPSKRLRDVVHVLQQTKLKFETVPTLDQLATGKVKVTQLRPVEIEDLLGREPVKLEMENIWSILQD